MALNFDGLTIESVLLRLVLAAIFGGLIGFERGIKGRPAGMRTYMLVCMASALVMCTNMYVSNTYQGADPTRMSAQVVSGIGFLGVGTIIVTRNRQVKGLTTAAGLWGSACLGLAVGAGFFAGAIIGAVLIFVINTVMHSLDNKLRSRSRVMEIYLELRDGHLPSAFLDYTKDSGYVVSQMQTIESKLGNMGGIAAYVSLDLPRHQSHNEVLDILNKSECVRYIEEV